MSPQQEAFLQWMQARSQLRHPVPVSVALRIRDSLDLSLLERAVREVTLRHEALRTVFPVRNGHRKAMILDVSHPQVLHRVAAGTDASQKLAFARDLAIREREREFDLEGGPLARAVVIQLAQQDYVLLLAVHHLVCDGWSMEVMLRELGTIYSLLVAGDTRVRGLPEPMQCSEVTHLSGHLKSRDRHARPRALTGASAGPGDFKGRKPANRFSPGLFPFRIQAELASNMRGAAREHHATTFMVALTAWTAVLSEWSGTDDIVVMSPVAGRTVPGSDTAIGCLFFDALIRVNTAGSTEFSELLPRVRSATIAATSRPDGLYEDVSAEVVHPPYFSYYRSRVPLHFPGLQSESFTLPPLLAPLVDDLEVPILRLTEDHAGAISAELVFNQEAFCAATIAELADDFVRQLPGTQLARDVS